MEPASSPLPSPSSPWSHIAVTHGDFGRQGGEPLGLPGPHAAAEDAAQLRARLLRMIVDSEQSRKSTAAENFHAR
jgi:hypothetical protein